MKIKFLGTCAAEGTPAFFCECEVCRKASERGGRNIRTRSQCLVDDYLLIDYPPDTYMHVVNASLDLKKVKAVLITHTHSDHFCVDDINMNRPPCAVNEKYYRLPFYGNSHMYEILTSKFGDGSHVNLSFHKLEIFNKTAIGPYTVLPLRALHDRRQDCLIFSIEKKVKDFLWQ